ncbi:PIN domain-containing protein [Amycolatopsis sp. GA6-003]|uniref:PIN domain-containing protein n=1 Tax=Amycolatopsis sp. GA6-003 TaxID=2652444 RepID=UPI00391734A5
MAIFLDTCVLPRRGRVRTPIIDALLRVAAKRNIRVCLPLMTLEESVSARGRESREAFNELLSAFNSAAKFFPLDPIYIPDAEEVETAWRQELESEFEIVELHSEDAHESLLRESRRRKPAKEGRGSRDTAIWLTVVREHLRFDDVTYFVSSNTADFAAKNKKDLHEDLRADLGTHADRFHYCTSLDELISNLAERIDLPAIDPAVAACVADSCSDAFQSQASRDLPMGLVFDVEIQQDPKRWRTLRAYKIDSALIALFETEAKLIDLAPETEEPIEEIDYSLRIWVEIDESTGEVNATELDAVDRKSSG